MSGDAGDPSTAVRYRVVHRTTYAYGARMSSGSTLAHLVPRDSPHQRVTAGDLTVVPLPDERVDWLDAFGNCASFVAINGPHDSLELVSTSTVAVSPDPFDPNAPREVVPWEGVAARLDDDLGPDALGARMFRVASRLVPTTTDVHDYAAISFRSDRDVVDAVADLCHRIYEDFDFDPSFSDVTTPVSDVLAHRRGVCQDFAHLALACLRSHRLPARYVSGYIETLPSPGAPKLVGSDASHAWVSVYVPDHGWIDVDPTNNQLPARRHVTTAWGRDYSDVAPVQGVVLGPSTHQVLEVAVDVTPLVPRR